MTKINEQCSRNSLFSIVDNLFLLQQYKWDIKI